MMEITINKEYLQMIKDRTKSLEIRVGYTKILSIRPDNQILFISGSDRQMVTVTNVRRYATFTQMLAHEDFTKIIPGLSEGKVLDVLRQIYPPVKESLGVVVLDVFPVESAENDI